MSDDADKPYPDNFIVNIPDEHLTAIGKVCVSWGVLETVVDLAIAKLGGFELFDPRSMIINAHMTWPLKMDIMESLITALREDHTHLAKFDEIKPLLKKAQEGRNRVVHGQWGYQNGEVSKLRATARGRLKASIDTITAADIVTIADDIGRAGAAIVKLIVNK
jgi:hypothetical protein